MKKSFVITYLGIALAVGGSLNSLDAQETNVGGASNLSDMEKSVKDALSAQTDVVAWAESLKPEEQKDWSKKLDELMAQYDKLPDAEFRKAIEPLVSIAKTLNPGAESPIKNPVLKKLLLLENRELKRMSKDELIAMGPHRLARTLGDMPEKVKLVSGTAVISSKPDKTGKWWGGDLISTGFYALPGKAFKVTVPKSMVGKDIAVQIGHHNDAFENNELVSMPQTTVRTPITQESDTYISPHGGLILIYVPHKPEVKNEKIKIENAIQEPRFILGKTTNAEWNKAIKNYPAPWGELIGDKIILTVKTEDLRNLKNPQELLKWWNENNRMLEDFYGYDAAYIFRMQAMLYAREGAAYTPLEWQPKNMADLLNLEKMKEVNSALYLHEHGHHGDFDQMQIGFTSESTCNWAGYYMKSVIPFDWKDSHDTHLKKLFDPEDVAHNEIKQKEWYKISTKGTHHWSYPVTSMMIGYAEDFDWKKIKSFLHRYRNLAKDPLNQHAFLKDKFDDQSKIDRYLIGLSEEAKRDVRPYFAHFDYLPSEGATAYLDSLKLLPWDPTYMPIPEVTTTAPGTPLVIKDVQKSLLTMSESPELVLDGQPAKGKAELKDGNLIYTPNPKAKGKDKIPYVLKNKVGSSPRKFLEVTIE